MFAQIQCLGAGLDSSVDLGHSLKLGATGLASMLHKGSKF